MITANIGGLTVRITGGSDGDGGGDGLAVVLLHGFGAPGDDLVPLAAELAVPGVRYFFPEAPILLPPELGGGVGRAWWNIDMMRLQMAMMMGKARELTRDVPQGLAPARDRMLGMLAQLVSDHRVARDRLVLGGFSQGAMLACDVALRTDDALAGLALLSGTYLAEQEWQPAMAARAGLQVLQSHGKADPILPFDIAEQLRDALVEAGLLVDFVPFEGGHGIAPEVIAHFRKLLESMSG